MAHLKALSQCHWVGLTLWVQGYGWWRLQSSSLAKAWAEEQTPVHLFLCLFYHMPLTLPQICLPHLPLSLFPDLSDEQVKRWIPCTQLNLSDSLYVPCWSWRAQTIPRILLSWGRYRTCLTLSIIVIPNSNPQGYMLEDDKQRHCWDNSVMRVNGTG